jgi:hypothetical protein
LFSVGLIPENELTKSASVAIAPQTKGAIVDQTRETLTDGIFACGNVLQVHDLVDFVSEESEIAGFYAAKYVLNEKTKNEKLTVTNGENISYVVPQRLNKGVEGNVKLFFRVKNTFENCTITAKCGDKILAKRKKRIAVPGEMETLLLTEKNILEADGEIVVSLEV